MSDVSAVAIETSALAPPAGRGLLWKYVSSLIGLVGLLLVVNAAVNSWLTYAQTREVAARLQDEKADAAAQRIGEFIAEIERQIGWTTHVQWDLGTVEQRRLDYIRLMRQAPAISELVQIDRSGKEQLKVSRLSVDVVGSGQDYSADPRFTEAIRDRIRFSPVYFRKESEPFMTLSVARGGRNPGVTLAEVNLKLIWDVITTIRMGKEGYAYVVDNMGRLIAHPDISLVLRNTDMKALPQVAQALARQGQPHAPGLDSVVNGRDMAGRAVITADAPIPRLNWSVLVEVPESEALATVWSALYQNLLLLAAGLLLAVLAAYGLARRMVAPIEALSTGAVRLGGGDFSHRIEAPASAGREIAALAGNFNRMGEQLRESYAGLEAKVEARTRDLGEALAFQTATSDVLNVISRSATKVQPVLEAIVQTAARLCNAEYAFIARPVGNRCQLVAANNLEAGHTQFLLKNPVPIDETSVTGRVALHRKTLQVADVLDDPGFKHLKWQEAGKQRTVLGVPLLREGALQGVIILARTIVSPFSDKQIELVSTFADQAVIAIENARLFEEVQERTKELSRSLDDLRTAQDRLVQTEKLASLGQLTAGIAHEIKNPLNFVNNFSALSTELIVELKQALVTEDLRKDTREEVDDLLGILTSNLEKVVQHGKRADSIVKNMLLHSRTGAGERRVVDVNALAEESLNLAFHGARAEKPGFNVTLARALDPKAGEAELYPQEITRVLLNLITNGFYAVGKRKDETSDGAYEPTLSLSTRDLGDRVEIRVRDNGTGIPDAVRARVFDPFFTTKPAGEGTGLGLSLSHDIIVKQHGGTIDIATQPGEFTEFLIMLPRKARAETQGSRP